MNSRKKLVLVASLVTGALAYLLITGLVSYSMYDAKIADVISNPENFKDRGLKISGTVINGSIDKSSDKLTFTVKGEESSALMTVSYRGVIPDAFMDDASVIVEGTYDIEHEQFMATKLMAKCPSRYDGMDVEEHNKAMAEKNANL